MTPIPPALLPPLAIIAITLTACAFLLAKHAVHQRDRAATVRTAVRLRREQDRRVLRAQAEIEDQTELLGSASADEAERLLAASAEPAPAPPDEARAAA